MAIMQSCCCWRSLRRGCYASSIYTMLYFAVTIVTMGHFLDNEYRYLSGQMEKPESESFLQPEKITPITVALNITLLISSTLGIISCILLVVGVRKDWRLMLLPWIVVMAIETLVEIINLSYLFYLQTTNFNPITSFLFTLDFFIIFLNVYSMMCVISQYQEYIDGRGTAEYDLSDRASVQYTATAQQTTTTSSAPSGRRRSAGKTILSRADPEEASEAPTKTTIPSAMSRTARSTVKKHVQFPDDSCIEETPELPDNDENEEEKIEKPVDNRIISSLWVELETEAAVPER